METEVELRLASSMANMEMKIQKSLKKMSSVYSIPETIVEMEKLMQPKRSTWNAITMVFLDLSPYMLNSSYNV